jgi:hypothetical protein
VPRLIRLANSLEPESINVIIDHADAFAKFHHALTTHGEFQPEKKIGMFIKTRGIIALASRRRVQSSRPWSMPSLRKMAAKMAKARSSLRDSTVTSDTRMPETAKTTPPQG